MKNKENFNLKLHFFESSKSIFKHSFMAFILLFMYVPLMLLVMFAFNSGDNIFVFEGWSGKWFREMFANDAFVDALLVTIITSVVSTVVAVIIGTMFAIGLHSNSKSWFVKSFETITNYPIFIADVIIGVSLLILFVLLGMNFGLITMILAHITFTTPYVVVAILPKLRQLDQEIIDASFDLGASPFQTLMKVIVPTIFPAILAGAAMAFAMSFDDFVVSYFTGGNVDNISTWLYTLKKLIPIVNAFSVILISIVAIIFILRSVLERKKFVKENPEIIFKEKTIKDLRKKEFKKVWKIEDKKTFKTYFYYKSQIKKSIDIKLKADEIYEKSLLKVGDK